MIIIVQYGSIGGQWHHGEDAAYAAESGEYMTTGHPQETIIKTYDYKGVTVDLVEWKDTVWCGKIGYAADNTDEPDVEKIMGAFFEVNDSGVTANGREEGWDVCISLNYLAAGKSNGVMFGFLVESENQPQDYDLLKLPGAHYMRLRICDEAAAALEQKPWKGGVPPYGWIAEDIAPKLGYMGVDTSPVFEYYGYFDPDKNEHKYCYLYVPVRKA